MGDVNRDITSWAHMLYYEKIFSYWNSIIVEDGIWGGGGEALSKASTRYVLLILIVACVGTTRREST